VERLLAAKINQDAGKDSSNIKLPLVFVLVLIFKGFAQYGRQPNKPSRAAEQNVPAWVASMEARR